MTDKKRIDEALKKKEAEQIAALEEEVATTDETENAAETENARGLKTEEEIPSESEPSAANPGDTGKLIDAFLTAHAKIDALTSTINALAAENSALKAEVERLSAPVDYAAAIENDDAAEAAAIASQRVKNAVVAEYLRSLGNAEKVRVLTGETGSIPLAPVAKPKSLAEAKKLAEILIKG